LLLDRHTVEAALVVLILVEVSNFYLPL
jgi:hypothetical protein